MIDITPYVKIEDMSHTNFKTLMLFRCTTLEYAKKFLETGNLRFGLPKEWIDSFKKDGAGRGDLLEGAFASIEKMDERAINFYKIIRPNVMITENPINGFYYFQSKDVINMRTFCLFGLNDNMFPSQEIAEDKRIYPCGKISKKYFEDFAPNITQEKYDSLKPNQKPVVLMIKNPHEFFNRMKSFLHSFGLEDNEYIIHPVGYTDKHKQFFVGDPIPGELFMKDSSFSYQSEIRIVLFPSDSKKIQKIEEANGIFNIGPMRDIAEIQDYYFKDFTMQKRGNELIYSLPRPKAFGDSIERSIGFINQVLCNRLPKNCVKGNPSKEKMISVTVKRLKEKYHISFDREHLTFDADEDFKPTGQLGKGFHMTLNYVDEVLSGDGCALLDRREYSEAIKNFTDAIQINSSRGDFWYNRGIAYYMLCQYPKALADYSKAIKLDPQNTKYHFERAEVYNKIDLPEKAKIDYLDGIKAFGNIEDHDYKNIEGQKLLFQFALAAQKTEKYDMALSAISKCIDLEYNIPESYNIRGNIYQRLSKTDLALDNYKIYLRKNGNQFSAYLNLGVAYMQRGCDTGSQKNLSLSLEYYNKAKNIQSSPLLESNIRRWYINSFLRLGLYKEKFERAIIDEREYDPRDHSIRILYDKFIKKSNSTSTVNENTPCKS